MYDPRLEHDACGIGFVAHIGGDRSRELIARALDLLANLAHRSAVGSDAGTGDGAGILLQTPHYFLCRAFAAAGVLLPDPGEYGIGVAFLPRDPLAAAECERGIAGVAAEEGVPLLGWRDVPIVEEAAGAVARQTLPRMRQFALGAGLLRDGALERRLYVVRRRIEREWARHAVYLPSLSSRTLVYKGLLRPTQLAAFYPDLTDVDITSALAIVHSRFSTNTFPTWPLAHPYRMICHNGEINTLRGNIEWMRAREGTLTSTRFGRDLAQLLPVIAEGQSDSACFDNALEFLVMGGRPLAEAMMLLIPEAWDAHAEMDAPRRAFYEHHAGVMEPWDGPAAMAFTDGIRIGATLDRNGLRPARYVVTHDDVVILASEAGALPVPAEEIRTKGRLHPGRMLLIDTAKERIVDDDEVKAEVAGRRPYAAWNARSRVTLDPAAGPAVVELGTPAPDVRVLASFGYTREELDRILAPMATTGEEAVSSMGNDTPLAVLSERPQLLFAYFRQLFAQVTNPAIDPIREQLVMSLAMHVGPLARVLDDTEPPTPALLLPHPVLTAADMVRLAALAHDAVHVARLSTLWDAALGPDGLSPAVDALCAAAADAARGGATILVLTDRGVSAGRAAIPVLLATAAVHHHLTREGLRTAVGLIVETGEARDVAQIALLIGYGAAAVHPFLALETVAALARDGRLGESADAATAQQRYVAAVKKGLLKILSKMGISTLSSYCGAQVFEAIGLSASLIARHFTGTSSRLGGIGLEGVAREALERHGAAWGEGWTGRLPEGGEYHYRVEGEHHAWNPATIAALQHATRSADRAAFRRFSQLADAETRQYTLRGALELVERTPVPLDEVEPATAIVTRFVTGAMSFGALSREAHETLAIAMNRLGGRSNTGEGGEDATRFHTERNSAIKQVASARFGVSTDYLVNARELQIKISQGAKPGEGGQLPGHKVDEAIAAVRNATPGVSLISPPPHHDIYSIEDLAQLIFDLKNVNPGAAVSVKLVAEAGVGTVAAGVAKAHADGIVIAGDSGGTGASPVSSIKHAGIPWEMGIADSHQTLVLNGLRSRVRLQADGQLKTARDVVIAAILGADEFGFSTAPLIAEGCVMMRKCHLNTCPVGVATQDPVLRAKFTGRPEHVIAYFVMLAEEMRVAMARIGVRTVAELVGRTELLRPAVGTHWKAQSLDLLPLLHRPAPLSAPGAPVPGTRVPGAHPSSASLDARLLPEVIAALDRGETVRRALPVETANRTIGALLSGELARRYGRGGVSDDAVHLALTGSAGQSFGAFAVRGLTLRLEGEANDYVGKGLSGGRLIIVPPRAARFIPGDTTIIGNTALYGATSGEAYINGVAGERFAVRNSGATAVIEGVGDHGCEYMTGGVVVVLGRTGRNFAAGMSGGVAFVLDDEERFRGRCNTALVALEAVDDADDAQLLERALVAHAEYTGSGRAKRLLRRWPAALSQFVKVMPQEYKAVLARRRARTG